MSNDLHLINVRRKADDTVTGIGGDDETPGRSEPGAKPGAPGRADR